MDIFNKSIQNVIKNILLIFSLKTMNVYSSSVLQYCSTEKMDAVIMVRILINIDVMLIITASTIVFIMLTERFELER